MFLLIQKVFHFLRQKFWICWNCVSRVLFVFSLKKCSKFCWTNTTRERERENDDSIYLFQVFTIQEFKAALKNNCYNLPLWVLLLGNFSQLAMMINSSANFFIYCFMSNVFRECLHEAIIESCKVIGCEKVKKEFKVSNDEAIFYGQLSPASFPLIFRLSQTNKTIFRQNNVQLF